MYRRTTVCVLAAAVLIVGACVGTWAFSGPKIGDYVWEDLNGNGVQDSGEPGVDGVTVELWTEASGWTASTQTVDGYYEFIWNGTRFKLRFSLPDGCQFTTADQGNDDTVDSDADPVTGETEMFTVTNGNPDYTRDAGVRKPLIEVDVHPGSNPNPINLKSRGVVPVAILTSETFDATQVDPESVTFAAASPARWTHEDVLVSPTEPDGEPQPPDGDIDLLLFFNTQDLELSRGDTTATLTGTLYSGETFSATDTVKILGGPPRGGR